MPDEVAIQLTLASDADLERVAAAASALGMRVEQKLEALGVITGVADEGALDALRALPQVTALERSRAIKLPPRGSPIQ